MLTGMRRTAFPALSLAIAALVALSGCGGTSTGSGSAGRQLVVGISNPAAAQPVMKGVQDAFVAAAKRDGIEVKTLDAANNLSKQVSDIDQLVAQHVDAIVVYPLDANALAPALNRAKQAGIKLIGWSGKLDPELKADIAPYDVNVDTGGTYRGSALLSDHVKTALGGKGNALGVGLAIPVPALAAMLQQYQQGVSSGSDIRWLDTVSNPSDDVAGAQRVVTDALTRFKNDIQAVLAYNDDSAIGASIALKNAGVTNAVVVGQNGDQRGAQAVQEGQISATVDLVPWRQGLILESLTKALIDGQAVTKWTENPSVLYTKDNIGERLDWATAVQNITDGTLTCANDPGCAEKVGVLAG